MPTNRDVVRAFARGEHKTADNLAALTTDSGARTLLIGYGHAVYAMRESAGTVTRFEGWRGRSHTTNTHLGLLDGVTDQESPAAPSTGDVLTVTNTWEVLDA